MPLVHQPYEWQFHPPPYGRLRPVVGARPVRLLQTGQLVASSSSGVPLIQNYQRVQKARRLAIRPAATGLGAWPVLVAKGAVIAAQAIWALKARSGGRRILSTELVDTLEPVLVLNLDLYLAGPHTASEQALRLGEFDEVWAFLVSQEACGTDDLGQAGRRCISDRERDGQFDWFKRYRDPIANDPDVVADGSPVAGVPDFLASLVGGGTASATQPAGAASLASYAPLLIGIALIGAAFVAVK